MFTLINGSVRYFPKIVLSPKWSLFREKDRSRFTIVARSVSDITNGFATVFTQIYVSNDFLVTLSPFEQYLHLLYPNPLVSLHFTAERNKVKQHSRSGSAFRLKASFWSRQRIKNNRNRKQPKNRPSNILQDKNKRNTKVSLGVSDRRQPTGQRYRVPPPGVHFRRFRMIPFGSGGNQD
jgi:hypothetical protein